MRRSALVSIVTALCAGLVLASCSGSGNGAATNTVSTAEGQAIIKSIPHAVDDAGSVHFEQVTKTGGTTQTLYGNLSAGDAEERLLVGKGELDVERASSVIYVRGNPSVLENALKLPTAAATANAGKWISVQPSDAVFSTVNQTLDLDYQVASYLPDASGLSVLPTVRLHGHRAIPLVGQPPVTTSNNHSGTLTVYASATAPHLPIGTSMVLTQGSQRETDVIAYSGWGVPVKVTAPTGAVPYSTLAAA